ncbi:hypothetical protein, partial [Acinetobacter baumannii]|uniref:hypothetical protein n=1 Tax=Acinetobacter baumannii TaxID=470 RepID=UPI0033930C01
MRPRSYLERCVTVIVSPPVSSQPYARNYLPICPYTPNLLNGPVCSFYEPRMAVGYGMDCVEWYTVWIVPWGLNELE